MKWILLYLKLRFGNLEQIIHKIFMEYGDYVDIIIWTNIGRGAGGTNVASVILDQG